MLHDFAALCAVLLSLKYHHYCIWHALDKFEERVKKCVLTRDHLSVELRGAVDRDEMSLADARSAHCHNIVNEYASILLCLDRDIAVVRLEMFVLAHVNIPSLLAVLSSDRSPYHDIEAFLLSCTKARAINALCENVIRCFRKFQVSAGVARRLFINFSGVVVLALHVLGFMCSSARERQEQAAVAVQTRAAQSELVRVFTDFRASSVPDREMVSAAYSRCGRSSKTSYRLQFRGIACLCAYLLTTPLAFRLQCGHDACSPRVVASSCGTRCGRCS